MTSNTHPFRQALKSALLPIAGVLPQARYGRMILILSHMRAATTALSNVITAHPEVNGFGETQVSHNDAGGPARVALNLIAHSAFNANAPLLFDKVLHSHHHTTAPPAFFDAHAIFLLRRPAAAIESIQSLALRTGMPRYGCYQAASAYYLDRVAVMSAAWDRFPSKKRIGLLAEELWQDPAAVIETLNGFLPLQTLLTNAFPTAAAQHQAGRGDPFPSRNLNHISKRPFLDQAQSDAPDACQFAFNALRDKFSSPAAPPQPHLTHAPAIPDQSPR